MFPLLFLLGLLLYYSQQTVPTFEHFRNYLAATGKDRSPDGTAPATTGTASTAANVGRFLRRLATVATPLPEIIYENYKVCAITTVRYNSGAETVYLGWFGRWWLISETRVKGGATSTHGLSGTSANTDALDKAEELKETAINAKGKRNYAQAANAYVTAGEAFIAAVAESKENGDDLAAYEAAVCFEEAYKCQVQAANGCRHDEKAINYLERSIELFTRRGATGESRAANLLCKLAEAEISRITRAEEEAGPCAAGLRAAQIYKRAADLYERAGDGRHCYTRIHEAETAARFGHYLHAVHAFDDAIDEMRHRPSDKLLMPQHLFNGGLCWMALGAWGRLGGHNAKSIELLPSFETSPQGQFLKMAYDCAVVNDTDKFKESRATFTTRSHLESWQIRAIDAAFATLDTDDMR